MNRRRFLIASVGLSLSLLVLFAGAGSWSYLHNRANLFLAVLIKEKLFYLELDTEGLMDYCDDFLSSKGSSLMIKTGLAGIYLHWTNDLEIVKQRVGTDKIDALVDELTLNFLLSSDFFINECDEQRTVHFLSLYRPDSATCRNPFARLD